MKSPSVAAGPSTRDIRVDFLRGLALWFIFITHTPGNLLAHATLRNVALCDATEVFVLLAGYAAGIAYGRMLERDGWLTAAARIVGRMGTLYVAHIFLFVVFAAQVGFSAAALNQAAYLDELHLDPFGQEPYRALLEALLLRYQPHFLDILPLYIVVLGLFALALPLIRRPAWLLGMSVALYALTRALGIGLPSWTGGGWFFNPFAWQLLFAIGVVLGRADPAMLARRLPWNRGLAVLAGLLLLAIALALNLVWHGPVLGTYAPEWMAAAIATVDKAGLHPARLASVLLLGWLVAHLIPRDAAWLSHPLPAVFVMMGQQGLAVFCAGIFLSFLGRLALEMAYGPAAQALVNLVGLLALIGVAVVSAWYGGEGKRARKPSLPAAPGTVTP
ncbi:OpgC domain-containing protein [Roseomonas frigidaquae]|uniref:OpgC domain-containing protein n=1 Tax=Falsiroseomonas frigidaquae TaxID=487318 RepID=A0ABX1F2C9_9PROT|nr:OpgC domain-containing protein [Falsiroseomonas frigidaquae]NKE46505.1 OpgC domain-containing protein [Falsiroseomonas frigidaquae]